MRPFLIVLAAVPLALSGCGEKQETGNSSIPGQEMSAADVAANDATAIDAATGADANMAADVDINLIENDSEGGNAASSARSQRRAPSTSSDSGTAEEPAPEPAEPPANTAESNSN